MFRIPIVLTLVAAICLAQPNAVAQKSVIGYVLQNHTSQLKYTDLINDLKTAWNLPITGFEQAGEDISFTTGSHTVSISFRNTAISYDQLQASAEISWLWKTAETECAKNKSCYIIGISGSALGNALETNILFTKITASVLENSNSTGVFIPNRYLLLSKGFYLESARNMSESELPVYLWVYFGLLQEEAKSSGYTFGMQEFGYNEIEVVNSSRNIQEVHAMIYEIAHIVLHDNRHLIQGDTVENSENQQVKVSVSTARFLKDQTAKLEF